MMGGRHTPWRRISLEDPVMRSLNRRAIRTCVLCLIGLTVIVRPARAQGETFTGTADLKGPGGAAASTPITMSISQYTSAGDREDMLAALKRSLAEARAFLVKKKDLGSIQIGARQTPIKYAYAYVTPTGRLISIATTVPIETGTPRTPRAGFDVGVIFLDLPASGPSSGQIFPNANVKVDVDGSIVAEDASGEVVRLTNVAKK